MYIKNPETYLFPKKCSFLDPRFRASGMSSEDILEIKTELMSEMEGVEGQGEKRRKGLSSFLVSIDNAVCNSAQEESDRYCNTPNVHVDDNPLIWWKNNEELCPKLSVVATKFLSVPGTRVPSERVFSKGGNIITDNRNCLTVSQSEQLIFLSLNKEYIII